MSRRTNDFVPSPPRFLVPSTLAALLWMWPAAASDPLPLDADVSAVLDEYIAREQPKASWTLLGEEAMPGDVTLYRLKLVSQTWMGRDWVHPLNVLVPNVAADDPQAARSEAILVVTAGDEAVHARVCAAVAARIGAPVAVLHQVPNQPLLSEHSSDGRGLREDALIAQTFVEFAKTGDPDWPLLLPMTKSAIAAMDAIEEFSSQQRLRSDRPWRFGAIDRFLVTGASKRGWTTWLTAAADPRKGRVIAIAPMVYDNLNLAEQMPLHFQTWGGPSPSISDYTERDLLALLKSPRGRQLIGIVDPYAYRERITVPKLILLGTNDTYWPLDGIHCYLDELTGETFCHYVPNAGHGLNSSPSVLMAIAAFFDSVTGRDGDLPEATLEVNGDEAIVSIAPPAEGAEERPVRVRLLGALATTGRDFRRSVWRRMDAAEHDGNGGWTFSIPAEFRDDDACAALIGEIEFAGRASGGGGGGVLIHTPVKVIAPAK